MNFIVHNNFNLLSFLCFSEAMSGDLGQNVLLLNRGFFCCYSEVTVLIRIRCDDGHSRYWPFVSNW